MAKKTIVTYTSDISDKEGASEVLFGWAGHDYTIDLTAEEASEFEHIMEKYLSVATRLKGKARVASPSTGPTPAVLRDWGIANGFDVPSRGRVPSEVREAYAKVQGTKTD